MFVSISYEQHFTDLFDGIRGGLGSTEALIFGGTGDGIYETSQVANYGVCALGIHSGGKLRWSTAFETGVSTDSYSAARSCALKTLAQIDGQAAIAFVLADGVKADGSRIVAGINSVLRIPYFGGLTGDDRKFTRSRVLLNGQELEDAVAILVVSGELTFSINAASGWLPIGILGEAEECEGNSIRRISGVSAQTFMKEQLGKPLGEADIGIIPLATYPSEGTGSFSLRSLSSIDPDTGAIHLFGSVDQGTTVRVCTATLEEIINGVSCALEGLDLEKAEGIAAVVVSCAGRKWLLEDQGKCEVERILATLGRKIPLVGFPSFGEMAPFRKPDGTYTETFFHNVTCVICVIGG
ncbi:MAG: FIST N-terminal domain-containing protein [bacterium]|nr:FIST N-terminal domain-containing protein [bacterium]